MNKFSLASKRSIFSSVEKWINRDEFLILTWSRQVWKTTILKTLKNNLDKENKKTYFFNLEDFEILEKFNENPKFLLNLIKILEDEKIFIFIDEIQYLKNPSNFLKYFFDEFWDKMQIICSWSSAFYIDKNFTDSLAWRKKIFKINTLSFEEFLIFKNREDLINLDFDKILDSKKDKLIRYFDEYFIFWWYPKIVLEEDLEVKKELLWELVNSYLKKDIEESEVRLKSKFLNLYKILFSQIWNLLNKNELAKTLWLTTSSVENYIYILEKTFHIYLIKPYFSNIRNELTKMPKIFIQDTWIKNYLEKNYNSIFDRTDKWSVFENFVFKKFLEKFWVDEIKFWRDKNKNEVDFVISENKAFEVKFNKDKFKKSKYKTFNSEYKKLNLDVIDFEDYLKNKKF